MRVPNKFWRFPLKKNSMNSPTYTYNRISLYSILKRIIYVTLNIMESDEDRDFN